MKRYWILGTLATCAAGATGYVIGQPPSEQQNGQVFEWNRPGERVVFQMEGSSHNFAPPGQVDFLVPNGGPFPPPLPPPPPPRFTPDGQPWNPPVNANQENNPPAYGAVSGNPPQAYPHIAQLPMQATVYQDPQNSSGQAWPPHWSVPTPGTPYAMQNSGPSSLMILDTDRNAEISADEMNAAPQQLKQLDKNHDGKLTRDEVGASQMSGGKKGKKGKKSKRPGQSEQPRVAIGMPMPGPGSAPRVMVFRGQVGPGSGSATFHPHMPTPFPQPQLQPPTQHGRPTKGFQPNVPQPHGMPQPGSYSPYRTPSQPVQGQPLSHDKMVEEAMQRFDHNRDGQLDRNELSELARAMHGPQQHGPQQHGPQQHGPQQHGPQQHGPQQHGPQQHGPQQHGPQQHGPQQHGPQQHGPQQHGPQQHGPQQHGPQQQYGAPQYGPENTTPPQIAVPLPANRSSRPERDIGRPSQERAVGRRPDSREGERDIQPRGDQPRGDQPRGDQPRGDQPRGDQPRGGRDSDKPSREPASRDPNPQDVQEPNRVERTSGTLSAYIQLIPMPEESENAATISADLLVEDWHTELPDLQATPPAP